jgi:hypothetical protein
MPKLLYSATDAQGHKNVGFVEADSNVEALAKLRAAQLSAVELHDEPAGAALRPERAGLSEAQAARLAAFELRARRDPGIGTVISELAHANAVWIALVLGVALWRLVRHEHVQFWVGIAIVGAM